MRLGKVPKRLYLLTRSSSPLPMCLERQSGSVIYIFKRFGLSHLDIRRRFHASQVLRYLKTVRHRLWNLRHKRRSWNLWILTETAPPAEVIAASSVGRRTPRSLIRQLTPGVVTADSCFRSWVVDRKSPLSGYKNKVVRWLCKASSL